MGKKVESVIILTNTLKNGGAEKQSIMLAKTMQQTFRTKLIVYYGDKLDERLMKLVEVYGIDIVLLFGNHLQKFIRLFKLYRTNKRSVSFSYLATTNVVNALVGKISGVCFLVGGIRSAKITKAKMLVQRFLHNYMLSRTVFNNFQGMKELTDKGFKLNKSLVIHNCIDVKQKPRIQFGNPLIVRFVTLGRFVPQKDYNTALASVKKLLDMLILKKSLVKIEYLIVGYGELEDELREVAKIQGLDKFVTFVINPKSTNEYLEKGDIYLSTSLVEGLSNSIMEAMEYSMPIVATNVGDNDKLVQHGINGYLTKVGNTDQIAQALFELVVNADLRREMGLQSYQLLINNFTIEPFEKRYKDLILTLENES